jgi:hypothetical protein
LDFHRVTLKPRQKAWDWPLTQDDERVEEKMMEEV